MISLAVIVLLSTTTAAVAVIWEFGTSGQGKNPFTPRGYFVTNEETGSQWLRSNFDNSGEVIQYGEVNGLSYLDLDSSYQLYAMTDRNPTPGKNFLAAWKTDDETKSTAEWSEIEGFGASAGIPGRSPNIDPSGRGTCWQIPIDHFKWEKGTRYAFGFLRGMMANNGITLVLSDDSSSPRGYIQMERDASGNRVFSNNKEKNRYEDQKNMEYVFRDPQTGTVHQISGRDGGTMIFTVQTYADESIWNEGKKDAENFLNSVTEADYSSGKYVESNVKALQTLYNRYQEEAKTTVRRQLQKQSERKQRKMVKKLNEALKKARSEKPEKADLAELKRLIKEGKTLRNKVKDHIGSETGQYGEAEYQALVRALEQGEKALTRYAYNQKKIDQRAEELRNAIDELELSHAEEASWQFEMEGIYVTVPQSAFDQKPTFYARWLRPKSSSLYQMMLKKLADSDSYDHGIFVIQFRDADTDKAEQPKKTITVQVNKPSALRGGGVGLYRVADDGSRSELNSTNTKTDLVFHTDQTGSFTLLQSKKKKTTAAASKKKSGSNAARRSAEDSSGSGSVALQRSTDSKTTRAKQQTEMKKDKTQKKDYRPQTAAHRVQHPGTGVVNEHVTRSTDPRWMVYAAITLGVIALLIGLRSLLPERRRMSEQTR
ncbi:MAG: hypothetical protein ACOX41_09420 [Anaerovoracaceae bacterium]